MNNIGSFIGGVSLFLLLTCCAHDEKKSKQEGAGSETKLDIILSRRSDTLVEIGTSPKEMVAKLIEVRRHEDLLQFIKDRRERNNVKGRELDFNTYQVFEDIWPGEKKRIDLVYLIHNDSIKYGKIYSIDSSYTDLIKDVEFRRDTTFINEYVKMHNALYNTNRSSDNFVREITLTHQIRIACGNSSKGYGEREKALFKAIKAKDKAYVINLLTSMNPEEQTLGIIGVRKLMETGIKMDQSTLSIVEHIQNKNTSIFACITCSGGFFELEKYLKAYHWSEIPNITIQ